MSKFVTLFSSSSGNSACLLCGDTGILFDCGKSARTVLARLREAGIDPGCIRAICITHEHSDHISALEVLSGKLGCPVYASEPVAEYLVRHTPPRSELRVAESGGFEVGGIFVRPFPTPHDSVGPLGYTAHTADERTVGVATDLGHLSADVVRSLSGCDLVLLESNYDPVMLAHSSYPMSLRRRIDGRFGHLSNNDCAGFLPKLVEAGTTRVLLGHISRENNTLELVGGSARTSLEAAGMREGSDYLLAVSPRDELGRVFSF